MTSNMQIPTLIYLSIFYYTSGAMSSGGLFSSGVSLLDSYPSPTGQASDIQLPYIVLTHYDIIPRAFEIGGTSEITQGWIADVFASGEQQRDDLAYMIFTYFHNGQCDLRNYNEGFPPSVTPTKMQTIYFENVSILPPIYIEEGEAPDFLRWNRQIAFNATILI